MIGVIIINYYNTTHNEMFFWAHIYNTTATHSSMDIHDDNRTVTRFVIYKKDRKTTRPSFSRTKKGQANVACQQSIPLKDRRQ